MTDSVRTVASVMGQQAPAVVRGEQPFEVAASAFELLTVGPDPLSVDGAVLGGGLPPRIIVLSELAALLMHPSCGYAASDRSWRLLIERARTGGPAWTVGAVGVALPGLRRAAYRLRRYSGDAQAELLTAFVAALGTVKLPEPRVAQRLLTVTHTAARAALRASDTRGPTLQASPSAVAADGHEDFVLARAVAAGVITAAEAELIGVTRLEGESLAGYAARAGRGYWAVAKERERAERRLVTALKAGELDDGDAAVIREATMTLAPEWPCR
ncbi:hypothetical protein [Paractinoplanes globisporus]|uniref:Uncharacterized protein n=1 Tax=Paractinoplanes globisporus TaxID=113565 RepID=A0ABW6WIA0_9ACTN|nr:hypothetical protein [Actinoplanes globisporus]